VKKNVGPRNPDKKLIAAFVPSRMKNKVEREANRLGLNVSEFLRRIIDEHIPDEPTRGKRRR
tara:strand:- start:1517 stop:1702 length:186 start_codon:yes stop_codon:yes gene_type:complete